MEREVQERFARIELLLEQTAALSLKNEAALGTLIASIHAYVDDSKERTKRLEENLDALIRAITSEHQNGRNK